MGLTHLYNVGWDYGARMADHDYAIGNVGHHERVLREDLKRYTLPSFRAWCLGALRGYRS